MAMTKADLIEEVSKVVEMTRKDSEVIVEAIFDSVVRSLPYFKPSKELKDIVNGGESSDDFDFDDE